MIDLPIQTREQSLDQAVFLLATMDRVYQHDRPLSDELMHSYERQKHLIAGVVAQRHEQLDWMLQDRLKSV